MLPALLGQKCEVRGGVSASFETFSCFEVRRKLFCQSAKNQTRAPRTHPNEKCDLCLQEAAGVSNPQQNTPRRFITRRR
jgi:hypothetical protein